MKKEKWHSKELSLLRRGFVGILLALACAIMFTFLVMPIFFIFPISEKILKEDWQCIEWKNETIYQLLILGRNDTLENAMQEFKLFNCTQQTNVKNHYDCFTYYQVCVLEGRNCKEKTLYKQKACGYEITDEMQFCLKESGYYTINNPNYDSITTWEKCGEDFAFPVYCEVGYETKLVCEARREVG